MDQTDAELVRRALSDRRDQAAARALVERHSRAVFNLAYRLLGDVSDAEDVAQESFLKAFQRLSSFDPSRKFPPWLLRITHNTAIDLLRRRGRLDAMSGDQSPPVTSDQGLDPGRQLELRDLLEHGLGRLRPAYRAALVLRYQEGLGYAELAHVLGVPEGTAKTYVHRARRALAEGLEKLDQTPPPDR